VSTPQHKRHFVAVEPASVFQLGTVDDDLVAERLAEAADHQRCRERPRLRADVVDAADANAGFLVDFAPDRILDGLTGLDEAG
jgi:hypothetical protein